MDTNAGFSLQVELIRQIQADNGERVCYATPASVGCMKKQNECTWRHDCFLEAEGQDAYLYDPDAETFGESWFQRLD